MIEVDPAELKATVERYNKLCKEGEDKDFYKENHFLFPVEEGPFTACMVAPGLLAVCGGIHISDNFEVLNENDEPSPAVRHRQLRRRHLRRGLPDQHPRQQPRALPRAGQVPRRAAGRRVPGDLVSAEAAKSAGRCCGGCSGGGGGVGGSCGSCGSCGSRGSG